MNSINMFNTVNNQEKILEQNQQNPELISIDDMEKPNEIIPPPLEL